MPEALKQQNQPADVPPLEITGERTLPDVAEENYWFQRHLVVYRWIAKKCSGALVADMACGEGYGSDELARHARGVVGVDANPETFEHARLKYRRPSLKFERSLVEEHVGDDAYDAIVFLQTIEHLQDPGIALRHFRSQLGPSGICYISTPNRLTLAPPGAEKSDNPWHVMEYTAEEFHDLLAGHFSKVELHGVFHARKLQAHDLALKLGWDRIHRRLGMTDRFYRWFTGAIAFDDFRLVGDELDGALDFVAVCRN